MARLARNLGADGAVAFMEGTGNGTVDFMQTVKACEDEGIKTAAVLHESNGPKGYETAASRSSERSRQHDQPRQSIGENILIPPLATVIGGTEIDLHLKATHDARCRFSSIRRYFSARIARWAAADFAQSMRTSSCFRIEGQRCFPQRRQVAKFGDEDLRRLGNDESGSTI